MGKNDMHLSLRYKNSTDEKAAEYCMKDASCVTDEFGNKARYEYGKIEPQGKRNDLVDLLVEVSEGSSLKEVAKKYPATYVRNYRGIDNYKSLMTESRNWEMYVEIVWGDSGVGKTRYVVSKELETGLYIKPEGQWWDGYNGEEAVLIDDCVWSGICVTEQKVAGIPISEWLKIMDRYPYKVPVKGGYREFVSKRIYFTSMYDPVKFEQSPGVKRRLSRVSKLDTSNTN